ncbi:MAG TPA: UDP-glucose--hexose-1-phosphate uridylyltransferase [Candidatus Acidoferrum sp.]|nr:UDP-glucose--hexose-1-phosphate uridylyltransferase [Candidatus Acidoferrum sp.]
MDTPQADIILDGPHRRYDPLTDEWVLVSAGRTRRPWLGREELPAIEHLPAYDPECYLCPGNSRVGGERNPRYDSTFVFTNDFAALSPDTPTDRVGEGLFVAEGETGTCRVLCFSPRHDQGLAQMSREAVRGIVDLWASQTDELGRRYRWVQVFENRGESMGASNPHPHGQIWAGSALPRQAVREDGTQRRHFERHDRRLLLDYAEAEEAGPRVVEIDEDWLAVVPFWATWPFETLLIARRPVRRLPDLSGEQRDSLARTLISLLGRYDRLFDQPFPYSMGWHQAPFGDEGGDHWQLHAHFYPPLLRATIRKFMVGYELLAEPQRDLSPEEAAERLRAVGSEDVAANGAVETHVVETRQGQPADIATS